MKYPNIHPAIFLRRPNRFIAQVEIDGREETVHVKNTGRCRELLIPGCQVYLVKSDNPSRKTAYDLVAVQKGERLVNMDSQAPNHILGEYLPESGLFSPQCCIRPEYTHGDSRYDFLVEDGEKRHLIEVKGVTLEENGAARFPDAPTERGVKHIQGLVRAIGEGYESWICFVVQMEGITALYPNDRTHPAFGDALRAAAAAGVHVRAFGCRVIPGETVISYEIPVRLD
ncbi:MAG: DNA/RNA nuclease SfsA [Oscillospiraceae bacterium]|nr:DNA/RNA nuclease SfsA [Oscillospiraceae bacterium]